MALTDQQQSDLLAAVARIDADTDVLKQLVKDVAEIKSKIASGGAVAPKYVGTVKLEPA